MTIKVAYSTMGQSSPATVAEDAGRTGGYLYRGDPKRSPGHPDYVPEARRGRTAEPPPPASAKAAASKQERITLYCQYRAEGMTKAQAAAAVGVGRSAGSDYEAVYQQQREGQ